MTTANKLRAVILPGLDGTGWLLEHFVEALRPYVTVTVIAYPSDEPLSYDQLLDYVKARLPDEDFILIGESFSGPLALRIAAEVPKFLKGVVLGASFARLDMPIKSILTRIAGWSPPIITRLIPLNQILINGRATADQRTRLADALAAVDPKILVKRATDALTVDLIKSGITVLQPTLYLQATQDRLISSRSAASVALVAKNVTVRKIAAPHFLFQTEPHICAKAIADFFDLPAH